MESVAVLDYKYTKIETDTYLRVKIESDGLVDNILAKIIEDNDTDLEGNYYNFIFLPQKEIPICMQIWEGYFYLLQSEALSSEPSSLLRKVNFLKYNSEKEKYSNLFIEIRNINDEIFFLKSVISQISNNTNYANTYYENATRVLKGLMVRFEEAKKSGDKIFVFEE